MSYVRAAIMKAVYEADRLHQQHDSRARVERGDGRIDVFGMLVRRDIPVMFRPLKGLLGAYIDDPSPGIMVTTQRQLPVQRFTAAHELGHAALGHQASLDDDDILARTPFIDQERYSLQEIEANAFASELLMPKWLFAKNMSRQGWKPGDLSRPEVVYQLSLRLGTSYAATCNTLLYYKAISGSVHGALMAMPRKTIKQRLAAPHEPADWHGDVWLITERDSGIFLEGSRSDLVVLRFQEHSGSGYLWRLDELVAVGMVVVQDGRAADPNSDLIGGILSRTVIAEAQAGAKGAVHLREVRPWLATEPLQSVDLDLDLSGPVSPGLLPAQRELILGAP